jgi:hypothetical protein
MTDFIDTLAFTEGQHTPNRRQDALDLAFFFLVMV